MTTTPSRPQVPLLSLSSRDHDGVTVVTLRGELDFCGSPGLQAYLSDIGQQTRPRSVADLTLALLFITAMTYLTVADFAQNGVTGLGVVGAIVVAIVGNAAMTFTTNFEMPVSAEASIFSTGALPPSAATGKLVYPLK